jgi:hypothetical protein
MWRWRAENRSSKATGAAAAAAAAFDLGGIETRWVGRREEETTAHEGSTRCEKTGSLR